MKKYVSAILYAAQIPIGVWAGIELDHKSWLVGCILTGVLMIIEVVAVLLFMEGQTDDITKKIK